MKLVLLMFLLLQFASLAFAQQWLSTSAIAIVTSVGILALIYAIGIGLNSDDLKFLSSEELYQTLVTIVMISVVLGAENFLNAFSANFLFPVIPQIVRKKNLPPSKMPRGSILTRATLKLIKTIHQSKSNMKIPRSPNPD